MLKETLLSLALQCAPAVHHDTVLDVARTESGLNPFAIAEIIPKAERTAAGKSVITHMPATKTEAMQTVSTIEKKGRRYSVGLMQITSTNFSQYHTTAEQLFTPCNNLKVAEKIMLDCWQRSGKLKNALSCYYSGDPMTGQKREKAFSNTSYVERIAGKPLAPVHAVIVPSTRELKKQRERPRLVNWLLSTQIIFSGVAFLHQNRRRRIMSKNHTIIVGETGSGKTFFPTQNYQFLATTSLDDVKASSHPLFAQSVLQQCATKILLGENSEHDLPTKQETGNEKK